MVIVMERKSNDYNNSLTKVFDKLSIETKYKVLGAASLRSTLYINDYDLHDYFKSNSSNALNRITQHFKKLFKDTYNDSSKWITDFKCGINPYGTTEEERKIRWDRHDIQRSYKVFNGHKIYFKDCILDPTIMKIDYVVLLNGQFVEISENYNITIKGKSNEIYSSFEKEMKEEIKKYKKEGNLLKAYKREFSLLRYLDKDKRRQTQLINLFNSEAGYVNKIINELKLVLLMTEQTFRPVSVKDLRMNLQIVKQQLSAVFEIKIKNFSRQIEKISKEESWSSLNAIINYLQKKLNANVKKYI
jgi:hypothetical protein